MTTLQWSFDREFCPIECHTYRPAAVTESQPVRRGLSWRTVGQLLAGALWAGCAAGVVVAIIAGI